MSWGGNWGGGGRKEELDLVDGRRCVLWEGGETRMMEEKMERRGEEESGSGGVVMWRREGGRV